MPELMTEPRTSVARAPDRPEPTSVRLQVAILGRVRLGRRTVRDLVDELERPRSQIQPVVDRLVADGLLRSSRGWLELPVAPVDPVVSYGERCRATREIRGWSQFDLAVRLSPLLGAKSPKSVQSSISAIERGRDPGERWRAALDQVLAEPTPGATALEDAPTELAPSAPAEPREGELGLVIAALDRMGVPPAPDGLGLAWRLGFMEGRWASKP
jgi:transcriptional regulator with XRE-family HTH domain